MQWGEYIGSASTTMPLYVILLIVIDVVSVLSIGIGGFFVVRRVLKNKKTDEIS